MEIRPGTVECETTQFETNSLEVPSVVKLLILFGGQEWIIIKVFCFLFLGGEA